MKQNVKYFVTLKITLTECDSLTIRVNGQSVTLTAGENNIKVSFEHWYNYDANRQEWDRWQGNYAVDIQFPGTGFEGVTATKVGIEVSDVAWYYVKGQEPTAANRSAVLASGDTLIYTATAEEIGDGTADGIVAQLNIGGNGKYIRFCPNGLYINSDEGEEEVSSLGFEERKKFDGAEFMVEVSVNLQELLRAKKKM